MPRPDKRLYRVADAVEARGYSERHLRYLVAKRKIAVVKIGRAVYIPGTELDRIERDGYRPAAGGDAA